MCHRPMILRIPKHYDDTPLHELDETVPLKKVDDSQDNDDMKSQPELVLDDDDDWFVSTKPIILADTIRGLVKELKAQGYERSSDTPMTMLNTQGPIATKDWILQQGEANPHVATVLLGHIGALDHMVECLHYNCVWIDRGEKESLGVSN